MDTNETPKNHQEPLMEDPMAELERILINRYLEEKGYRWCELLQLPADDLKKIMIEACSFASSRLAEVEAKAGFRQEIRYK